ncbi:hypothetical protein TNCV_5106541 [Trichonephila clavipes]|nr:hypothetical protein TNCV_5106541 [Trichonephila clavipes]
MDCLICDESAVFKNTNKQESFNDTFPQSSLSRVRFLNIAVAGHASGIQSRYRGVRRVRDGGKCRGSLAKECTWSWVRSHPAVEEINLFRMKWSEASCNISLRPHRALNTNQGWPASV